MSIVTLTETPDGIALLTIDRPERRNALSGNALAALHRTFDSIAARPDLRAVVVTGAGVSFCSGADMKSGAEDMDALEGTATGELMGRVKGPLTRNFVMQELMAGLFEKIHRLRQPVIAAVNGTAHGGGFALALACDIRFAARSATFGAVFIKRGVSACDMGTSYYLPRLVGASRSAELLLTGRVFDAAEAERIGLVIEVVEDGTVVERALAKAREIAENSPLAVWMTKETMWQTVDSPSLRHALDLENRTQILCTATGELNAAFAAFREGRKPEWSPL
ncbi:MAG: enoyl-CoA hydratase/isomerase family protein [Deltaproteobacteria bacterium]|nr:enoyl-CoA hydratase/isomerase family protein [Deltaproteobacteria bacterium]